MSELKLPRSQGQLIKTARGERSQKLFAQELGVDRSCLSRYENEQLGAPTSVLNHCLSAVASLVENEVPTTSSVQRALLHARQAVCELEVAADEGAVRRAGQRPARRRHNKQD